MNDASRRHLSTKQPSIGIRYGQYARDIKARYEGRLLNGTSRKMVRKTTVRWIPISPEMYIGKILLVRRGWRIERIPFARRKFRPSGDQSKGIGEQRDGSKLSREKRGYN
jgi:hypothetical protein